MAGPDEQAMIERLMRRNEQLRDFLAEIWFGRWKHSELPEGMREAAGKLLLPGEGE